MTDKMQNALRHIETAVDVDEWAVDTIRECFLLLDKYSDAYNKGWKDGAEAVAFHEELSREENNG